MATNTNPFSVNIHRPSREPGLGSLVAPNWRASRARPPVGKACRGGGGFQVPGAPAVPHVALPWAWELIEGIIFPTAPGGVTFGLTWWVGLGY